MYKMLYSRGSKIIVCRKGWVSNLKSIKVHHYSVLLKIDYKCKFPEDGGSVRIMI